MITHSWILHIFLGYQHDTSIGKTTKKERNIFLKSLCNSDALSPGTIRDCVAQVASRWLPPPSHCHPSTAIVHCPPLASSCTCTCAFSLYLCVPLKCPTLVCSSRIVEHCYLANKLESLKPTVVQNNDPSHQCRNTSVAKNYLIAFGAFPQYDLDLTISVHFRLVV